MDAKKDPRLPNSITGLPNEAVPLDVRITGFLDANNPHWIAIPIRTTTFEHKGLADVFTASRFYTIRYMDGNDKS